MDITWKVISLQKQDIGKLKDVAVFASFTATATDGDKTASVSYSVNLLEPDPKSFTKLSSAIKDQEILVEWVKAAMAQPNKTDVEAELIAKLNEQETVTTLVELPQ